VWLLITASFIKERCEVRTKGCIKETPSRCARHTLIYTFFAIISASPAPPQYPSLYVEFGFVFSKKHLTIKRKITVMVFLLSVLYLKILENKLIIWSKKTETSQLFFTNTSTYYFLIIKQTDIILHDKRSKKKESIARSRPQRDAKQKYF